MSDLDKWFLEHYREDLKLAEKRKKEIDSYIEWIKEQLKFYKEKVK